MKYTPLRWIAVSLVSALFGQTVMLQVIPLVAKAMNQNPASSMQNITSIEFYESEIARAKNVYMNAGTLAGTGKYIGKTADQVRAGAHAYAESLRKIIAQVAPPPKPYAKKIVTPVSTAPSPIVSPVTDILSLMDSAPNLGLTSGTTKVVGDASCISKTNAALNLLKTKAPLDYARVAKYVGTIECVSQGSGMWAWESPPRYTVGKVTLDADTMWYAGTIAHDSCHSVQYNAYKASHPNEGVPASVYSGEAAEAQCLEVQHRSLQRMGASSSTLTYMKTLLSTKYWTGDYTNRWW